MYDWSGFRTTIAEGVDVCHDIVAELPFVFVCLDEVNVIKVCAEFGKLLLGDGESEFCLGFGKGKPKSSPSAKLPLRTPQVGHLA